MEQARGESGREAWWKEREAISQRTCLNDPWTWTRVWRLTVGIGGGLGRGGQMRKIGTTVIE